MVSLYWHRHITDYYCKKTFLVYIIYLYHIYGPGRFFKTSVASSAASDRDRKNCL